MSAIPDPGPLDFKIPHPDIIILSHHHWDHVHIPTLYAFNKETTPIYIPENEQLQMILDILGFYGYSCGQTLGSKFH